MAHDKLNLMKQSYFDANSNVHLPQFGPVYIQKYAYRVPNTNRGRISTMIHGLLNLFHHHETDMRVIAANEDVTGKFITVEQSKDEQLLIDLENCANAARSADDGGQYDWD